MATSSRSFSIVSKWAFALSSGPAQLTTSSSAGDWPTYSRQAPTLYIRLQGSLGEIAFVHHFRYLKQRQAPLFSSTTSKLRWKRSARKAKLSKRSGAGRTMARKCWMRLIRPCKEIRPILSPTVCLGNR